jgi:hypothetical protein
MKVNLICTLCCFLVLIPLRWRMVVISFYSFPKRAWPRVWHSLLGVCDTAVLLLLLFFVAVVCLSLQVCVLPSLFLFLIHCGGPLSTFFCCCFPFPLLPFPFLFISVSTSSSSSSPSVVLLPAAFSISSSCCLACCCALSTASPKHSRPKQTTPLLSFHPAHLFFFSFLLPSLPSSLPSFLLFNSLL